MSVKRGLHQVNQRASIKSMRCMGVPKPMSRNDVGQSGFRRRRFDDAVQLTGV